MIVRALVLTVPLAWAFGCFAGRPVHQTSITQVREQDALVMAPEAPVGLGPALPAGASSLSLGAGITAVLPAEGDVGQQALPAAGMLRAARALGPGVEITASASVASPEVSLLPLAAPVDGYEGALGRGAAGFRGVVPLGEAQWGWSVDLGAEASHVSITDTTVVTERSRGAEPTSTEEAQVTHAVRLHPHARTGTSLRVPVAPDLSAVGGVQLQSWPAYWASRSRTETCTTYRGGDQECGSHGSVDVAPSPLVAVVTPAAGLSARIGSGTLSAVGWANFGPPSVRAVPWGGMLVFEQVLASE